MILRKTTMAALMGVVALAACEPGPAGTNTQTGAVTGALLGGLFGATRNGDDKLVKAAVGAGVGAAVGGLIGSQLDAQARELEQQQQAGLLNRGIRIINEGNQLRVIMPEGILFATGSATVQGSVQNDLYALADNMNRYPNTRIEVVGHTDNVGAATFNQDLSNRRAAAVASVLQSAGVSGARIVSYGRGEDMPAASNLTPEGRQQNRRVEIVIIPRQG
jgi:outer membrane protein OmpA-like peptidoglycan-associated protein